MGSRAAPQCFNITRIQTVTFPVPRDLLTLDRNRRFYVSATDGTTTKRTMAVLLQGHSLRWTDPLDGFVVNSSSRLTINVFEEHGFRDDNLLSTFTVPYEMLCSSGNEFSIQSANQDRKKKSPSREIRITLLKQHERASDTVPDPLLSSIGEVEATRSLIQRVELDTKKLDHASEVTSGVAGAADGVGEALDTAGKVVTYTHDFLRKCQFVSDQLGFIVGAVDKIAEIHPYAKLAWSVISLIPKTISNQIKLDDDIMALLDELKRAIRLAPDTETLDAATLKRQCQQSENRKETFNDMMGLITNCGYFIQSYAKDVSFWKRLGKNIAGNKKDVIKEFRDKLKQLRDAFINETTVEIGTNILRVLGHVKVIGESLEDHILGTQFPYVKGARFNTNKKCLPGTRVKFLDAISDWVNNVDDSCPKALLLFGQAGTGKSAIAHEIANRFHCAKRLTTSYCFVRGQPSGQNPRRFFTTLARDLCRTFPAFKTSLLDVLKDDPGVVSAEDYTTLFNSLIIKPLKDLQFLTPVIIVIDALDESEDAGSGGLRTGGNRVSFHSFLGQHLSELPSNFRILMTSRPDENILDAFPESLVHRLAMNDDQLSDEVESDIRTYIQAQLTGLSVSMEVLQQLTRKAECLFQWAYVACDYLAHPPTYGLDLDKCIQRVLHPPLDSKKAINRLDELYKTVLDRFNMDDDDVRKGFQSIMGLIMGAFEPLSMEGLNLLRRHGLLHGEEFQDAYITIKGMGSLLSHVNRSESTLPIAPLHTSFRDFLTSPSRSDKFYVDLNEAHARFTSSTLHIIQADLQFNMCKLETSYYLNSEVPDLDGRIKEHIPMALSYSCRFWAEHLVRLAKFKFEWFKCIKTLIEEKLLFWLEVLSLKGELAVATTALSGLRVWLSKVKDNVQDEGILTLDALVENAITFVQYFGYPMAQSAPHIYLSALPFSPSASPIAIQYLPQFQRTLNVKSGRLTKWPPLMTTISVPDKSSVNCVALSHNEYVAMGLADGNTFIWNLLTRAKISGPLSAGRKDEVLVSSVAFSRDGVHLASGLSDGRIHIWLVTTGEEAREALKEQVPTGAITALSFSEDGEWLVSGSIDCVVRIWAWGKGEVIAGPFGGHKNPVWMVTLTPDCEHVVSQSGFRTLQVWSVGTKQKVTPPLNVPTGIVAANIHRVIPSGISYTVPNNSSFVPCHWAEAVEGEEEEYTSEELWEFDHSWNLLISAGYHATRPNKTDWSYNTTWYHPITETKFDNSWILGASFSQDGKFVATSSVGKFCLWYANSGSAGNRVARPFSHTNVMCLAFSADGRRIVSGSRDGEVRVWNVWPEDESEGMSEMADEFELSPVSVAFADDGKKVVVVRMDGSVDVLDLLTGQEVKISESAGYPELASLNGDLIALTSFNKMRIFTQTGNAIAELRCSDDGDWISAVAFSPILNNLLAFGTSRGIVQVFDASTSAQIAGPKQICDHIISSLALSPSTQLRIAVASSDRMFIWDTHSGKIMGPFTHHQPSQPVSALVFSADARHITSVAKNHTLCVWDSMTGNIVRGPVGLSDGQMSYAKKSCWPIALAQDGQRVAFVGNHDRILVFEVVYIGDSEVSLSGPLALAGHTDCINFMALSRDGRLLATTSRDFTVRIWNIQTAMTHKQVVIDSASDSSELPNLDEAFVDDDGWATCPSSRGGSPLRLMWIPETHRKFLQLSISVGEVVSDHEKNGKKVQVNLDKFVHGKDWARCKT